MQLPLNFRLQDTFDPENVPINYFGTVDVNDYWQLLARYRALQKSIQLQVDIENFAKVCKEAGNAIEKFSKTIDEKLKTMEEKLRIDQCAEI